MKIHEHVFHFVILVTLLALGSGVVLFFGNDRTNQLYAVICMAVTYVLWGIFHHLKTGDLHRRIFLEYLLIAILGSLVLFSAIR